MAYAHPAAGQAVPIRRRWCTPARLTKEGFCPHRKGLRQEPYGFLAVHRSALAIEHLRQHWNGGTPRWDRPRPRGRMDRDATCDVRPTLDMSGRSTAAYLTVTAHFSVDRSLTAV